MTIGMGYSKKSCSINSIWWYLQEIFTTKAFIYSKGIDVIWRLFFDSYWGDNYSYGGER